MANLKNIPLAKARRLIISKGFTEIDSDGHYKYRKQGNRTIVLQNHIDPVPVRIIKQVCRHLNMSNEDFCKQIDKL